MQCSPIRLRKNPPMAFFNLPIKISNRRFGINPPHLATLVRSASTAFFFSNHPVNFVEQLFLVSLYSPLSSYSWLTILFQNLFHQCNVSNVFVVVSFPLLSSLTNFCPLVSEWFVSLKHCTRHNWLTKCFSNVFRRFCSITTKFHTKHNRGILI